MSDLAAYLQRRFDAERAAIASELHDVLGGLLVSAKINIGLLEQALVDDPAGVHARLTTLKQSLDGALALERRVVDRLYPSLLVHMGLYATLRWTVEETCRRADRLWTVNLPDNELRIPPDVAIGLYRVAEDALTDVLDATLEGRIELEVLVRGQMLMMKIASTGKLAGADPDPATTELARLSMHHRTASIGGRLRREMHPPARVEVIVELPLATQP